MATVGTGITISGTTNGSWAEVLDVTPPNVSVEDIETFSQSDSDYRTYTPTLLKDPGELSFDILFNGTLPTIGVTETVTLSFPDSGLTTWSFDAYIKSFEPSGPLEDRMTATVTYKVTGGVTES